MRQEERVLDVGTAKLLLRRSGVPVEEIRALFREHSEWGEPYFMGG